MYSKKITAFLSATTLVFFLSSSGAKSAEECFENVSRGVFQFNLTVDRAIIEPIAKGYNKLPEPIKNGTSNFTSNIATLLSIPNTILQGDFKAAGHSMGSFIVNSSIGILGIFNPAEKIGLKSHNEDVGQTLGTYGFGPGCYLVLPIFGPSTARDTLGLIADTYVDPFAHITIREKELFSISGNDLDYYSVKGTTAVNFRSDNIRNFDNLEKNSIDLYSAYKSLYLQSRENKIQNSSSETEDWENLDN